MEVGGGGDDRRRPDVGPEGAHKQTREKKSRWQLEILKEAFAVEPRPSVEARAELAEKTGLPLEKVSMWFATTRFSDKGPPSESQSRRPDRPPLPPPPNPLGDGLTVPTALEPGESSSMGSLGVARVPYIAPSPTGSRRKKPGRPRLPQPSGPGEGSASGSLQRGIGHRPTIPQIPSKSRGRRPARPPLSPPHPLVAPESRYALDPGTSKISGELARSIQPFSQQPFLPFVQPPVLTLPPHLPQPWMPHQPLHKLMIPEQQRLLFPHLHSMFPPLQLSQSSEHTVEEGSVYGVEFDPLPPGAFGVPIGFSAMVGEEGAKAQSSDCKSFEGPEAQGMTAKASERNLQEYQGQISTSIIQPQEYEQHSSLGKYFTDNAKNDQYGIGFGPEKHITPSDGRISCDDRASQMERMHEGKSTRCEGERMALEVGAPEKIISEQLGKEDSLEKRVEQRRIELSTLNYEREKVAEGLVPEKQQLGKFQMELHHEIDSSEILQKESLTKKEHVEEEGATGLIAVDGSVINQRIGTRYRDLIEDERLEFMRFIATSKGLSSISSLDVSTLQQIDLCKDMLITFPPASVPLKRLFSVQPWTESEESIGNLLMVWKFLTTFADVLELWSFTLDELVQSLHDYDSRLLGEVHVALLNYILRDVENGAYTPDFALRPNKTSATNSELVQKRIVEGASIWGFDICKWKRHMNFLTWPEILRQLALSIGFGPRLKKINADNTRVWDVNKGNKVGDEISSFRNGAAAENDATSIQGKNASKQSRYRHRLTPGTIKFAAFHVLSLEGEKGLRIYEIYEKIQKYELRDITNKAPEATIATVLSREANLFERVGPSTYSLRPSFRKNPADADVVLSTARERVRLYNSGLSESKRPEIHCENADDVEDSDYDGADDPKINGNLSSPDQLVYAKESILLEIEKGKQPFNDVEGFSSPPYEALGGYKHQSLANASNFHETSNGDHEETKIKGDGLCEPWVEGLTEEEYSGLSVEERLNVLVALIGAAIEGNSLHNALVERVKAANALKKLMWVEAKQERRQSKEEHMNKLHHSSLMGNQDEAIQNPLKIMDLNGDGNQGTVPLQRLGSLVEISTSEVKSCIARKAEAVHAYRFLPLGEDRRHNRYWQFSTSASPNEPGSGRIFFESKDGFWRVIDSEEAFNALLEVLDTRGVRESRLHSSLKKIEKTFKEAIQIRKDYMNSEDPATTPEHSASYRIEFGRSDPEIRHMLKRYQDFVRWMWGASFNPCILHAMIVGTKRCAELLKTCDVCYLSYVIEEKHCPSCHATFKACDASFHDHMAHCEGLGRTKPELKLEHSESSLPVNIRLLKAQLALIEVSIPEEALQPLWTEDCRKLWVTKLLTSSSAEDLLQILTQLEGAIKLELLSQDFHTTGQLLGSIEGFDINDIASGSIPVLPWVPKTTAAVAFRLLALDASIPYMLHTNSPSHEQNEAEDFMILPRDAAFKSIQHPEPTENLNPVDHQEVRQWLDTGSEHVVHARRQKRTSTDTSETDPDNEDPVVIKRGQRGPCGGGRGSLRGEIFKQLRR